MLIPKLVAKKCIGKGCKRTWRAMDCSTWSYCSQRCAMDNGRIRKDQYFRDQIAMTFVELSHPAPLGKKDFE